MLTEVQEFCSQREFTESTVVEMEQKRKSFLSQTSREVCFLCVQARSVQARSIVPAQRLGDDEMSFPRLERV